MDDEAKIAELEQALAATLEAIIAGHTYETKNPYSRACVQHGLRALAKVNGFSTFGSDWMDALDKWEAKQRINKPVPLGELLGGDL